MAVCSSGKYEYGELYWDVLTVHIKDLMTVEYHRALNSQMLAVLKALLEFKNIMNG